MSKTNCNICNKIIDIDVDTNYNVSWYHGKESELLIIDETCYLAKEKEYLGNYGRIWKETEKDGLIWIKRDENDCYAGHKDQNGKILKQKDCPHCQPWKHKDGNKNQKKCVNCGTVKNGYFESEGKNFCSLECIDNYRNKNPRQQKPPVIPPKNNNNGNRDNPPPPSEKCLVCGKDVSSQETSFRSKGSDGKSKYYCSLECLKKRTPSKNNPPQQEPPPKSQNNNKEMSTETKIILGVGITILVFAVGVIGVKIYKRSRQKTS